MLTDVLVQRYQAQALPAPAGRESLPRFLVRGLQVRVAPAAVWVEQRLETGAERAALMREVATAIDAELATGRHDGLFQPL